MSVHSETSRFICEIELRTNPHARRVLRVRMDCADLAYNAVLRNLLRALAKAREDPAWAVARMLPRGKERTEAFGKLRRRYGLSEYAAHKHPCLAKRSWLRGHLDANTAQKAATQAWKATERYMFGKAGKPRPRRRGAYASVEGKKATVGIRLIEHENGYAVAWQSHHHKLLLPLALDQNDPVHTHAMKRRCVYVRIVRRPIRRRERYFAQLVLDGQPLAWHQRRGRPEPRDREQGLDVGPSTVAQVTDSGETEFLSLCEDIDRKERARRRYQRRMDRQRRANNPERFRADGTVKPGRDRWKRSKRERLNVAKRAEMDRRLAAQRRNEHGRVSNRIVNRGAHIRTEAISHRAYQRAYGRSVSHKAPGLLMAMIERKALLAGGSWIKVPTTTTYLSQRCVCGRRRKKSLSNRRHTCGCRWVPEGRYADRDLFSAFLVMFANQKGDFDQAAAQAAWEIWGANCLLRPLSHERSSSEQPRSLDRQSGLAVKRTRTTGDACTPKGRSRRACGRRRSTHFKTGSARGPRALQNPPALDVGNS